MTYKFISTGLLLAGLLCSHPSFAADNTTSNTGQPPCQPPSASSGNNPLLLIEYYTCLTAQYTQQGYPNTVPQSNDGDLNGATASAQSTQTALSKAAQDTVAAAAISLLAPNDPKALTLVASNNLNSQVVDTVSQYIKNFVNASQNAKANSVVGLAPYFASSSLMNQTAIPSPSTPDPQHLLEKAANFILFLSGEAAPVEPLPATLLKGQWDDPNVKSYERMLAIYAAQQSSGIGPLNNLLRERMVQQPSNSNFQDTIGNPVGATVMKLNPSQPMSPLQWDQYMATRRVGNSNWYNAIAKATPGQLSQESLVILAEMRYEMFQQRMQLEQLNATLAGLQLTITGTAARANLQAQRLKTIAILNQPVGSTSSGTQFPGQ